MHIVFPLFAFNRSGGLRVTLQYANGLALRGHTVSLVVPSDSRDTFFPVHDRVEIIKARRPGVRKQWQYPRVMWSLSRAIPSCDVLVANSWQSMYVAWLSRRKCARGLVFLVQHYHVVSEGELSGRSALLRKRNILGVRLAYRIPATRVAVSAWTADQLLRFNGSKALVSSNGVDTSFFRPSEGTERYTPEAKRVLVIGREAPWKGYADALEAIRIARRSDPEISLIVVSNDHVDAPQDIPHRYVVPENDEWLREGYREADVFLFTSTVEGFGLPPLEAMACGTAVVTTDCGGVRDFAVDGVNCLLVPVKRPDLQADAILRLLRDAQLRNRIRSGGVATAKQFSLDRAIESFSDIVCRVSSAPEL